MESGSFTYLAFNPDLAVHFLNEAGGDGKPQAGAAVGSRRRTVRLRECFENRVLFFDWNADACVCDGKVQMALTVGRRLIDHLHDDFSPLGKLDRVIGEIDEDLAEAHRIADQMVRHVRGDVGHEFETFLIRANAERF